MFSVELLPAGYGDCIWIEYGSTKKRHRVLIDGGVPATGALLKRRLAAIPPMSRRFELLVVTHIDEDHIGGILKVLEDESLKIDWKDIWFNGWKHLKKTAKDALGGVQGERLSGAIERRKLPWNQAFKGHAVVARPRKNNVVTLSGGLKLTLLGPKLEDLRRLRPVWKREVERAGLIPGVAPERTSKRKSKTAEDRLGGLNVQALANKQFTSDTAEANGSSIAFLAEYQGVRCVFGADSHAASLAESLENLSGDGKQLKIDAFKIPHHGSAFNVSPELIRAVSCSRFLFSTNGLRFQHPDREAVARVITNGGKGVNLYFNYSSDQTRTWASASLQSRNDFTAHLPAKGESGCTLVLS